MKDNQYTDAVERNSFFKINTIPGIIVILILGVSSNFYAQNETPITESEKNTK